MTLSFQCSSKCGSGVQERKVTCISIHPDGAMRLDRSTDGNAQCDASEKPATQQQCNTQSCGSRWHYTPWTTVNCEFLISLFFLDFLLLNKPTNLN